MRAGGPLSPVQTAFVACVGVVLVVGVVVALVVALVVEAAADVVVAGFTRVNVWARVNVAAHAPDWLLIEYFAVSIIANVSSPCALRVKSKTAPRESPTALSQCVRHT
jgi:hypothetical protein